MQQKFQPYRSALYIPGANERALEKAKTLSVDAILFDLEDAVAPSAKADARQTLLNALTTGDYGNRARIIRINGFDTEWGQDDLVAAVQAKPDGILLPKVSTAAQVADLLERLTALGAPNMPIWAMIETPLAILNIADIASAPGMAGFVMGTNDLAKDLSTKFRNDRAPLMASLSICVVAAKAHGLTIIDGVYNAFKDDGGLRIEAAQGRDYGFDGKSLIHPAQVAATNEIFSPSEDEVNLAERQIEAYEAAKAEGKGIAVVDGQIVENLHVATAQKILAIAKAVK
ncbi:Putative citrate lyase beta chain [Rhodobacteraceae bacterium HTCC2150]|nr:Putative citrate lyase beta chain [Rhodobacteraceae bacterium HTCC2150]